MAGSKNRRSHTTSSRNRRRNESDESTSTTFGESAGRAGKKVLALTILAAASTTSSHRRFLFSACRAFAPSFAAARSHHHHRGMAIDTRPHHRSTSPSFLSTTLTSSTSLASPTAAGSTTAPAAFTNINRKTTGMTKQEFDDSSSSSSGDDNHHCLELDAEGNLRMDGLTVLLDGLTPSVWSASRPTVATSSSSKVSSLFLHASYAEELAEQQSTLGNLVACNRLLACARITRYWMGPAFGKGAKDVPFDTQFLLIETSDNENGPYALVLPLVDDGFRASLHYGGDDKKSIDIVCLAESGDAAVKSSGMRALYVAVGDDPYELVKRGFREVAEATGTFKTLDEKVLPPCIDDFGWCTWDAFYSQVTPDGVLDGVRALREAGVPPRTVIVDDGWQQVTPSPPDWKPAEEAEDESTDTQLPKQVVEEVEKDKDAGSGIAGSLASFFSGLVSSTYDRFVKKAAYGTKRNRVWSYLSKTLLRDGLWAYFDAETDFNRQLSGFPANYKFESPLLPDGDGSATTSTSKRTLKDLVTKLKEENDVKNVLCWHALHGYWRGVSEELGRQVGLNVTNVIPQPSRSLLRLEPQLEWDPVSLFGVGLLSNEADLAKFYQYLHAPLIEAGVDGVKVDVQSGVSAAGGGVGGGPELARLYTNAMEDSVSSRFVADNGAANCINCMCHSTENLYRYRSTSVARASDDFYPTRPESHTVHLVNVAYNSLFIGEICQPDWDMFHSLHESAGLHAAARAVGGCPVYVSDKPGQHDPDLLRKLVLPDGSVLRARLPGRPTRDCLFADVGADGESALKIWNSNKHGGVVGAFNVQGVSWNFDTHENEVVQPQPPGVTAKVKPHDVETLRGHAGPFAAYRHRTSSMEFLPGGDSIVEAKLDSREWEIFTVAPIQIEDGIMWAPVGLGDMMNAGGAIVEAGEIKSRDSSTVVANFDSRGPGRFVAFTNRCPSKVLLDGKELAFSHDEDSCELSIMLPTESENGQHHSISVEWQP